MRLERSIVVKQESHERVNRTSSSLSLCRLTYFQHSLPGASLVPFDVQSFTQSILSRLLSVVDGRRFSLHSLNQSNYLTYFISYFSPAAALAFFIHFAPGGPEKEDDSASGGGRRGGGSASAGSPPPPTTLVVAEACRSGGIRGGKWYRVKSW